jgi:spermidine/putrescine transport system ATP-binding protein
MGLGPLVAEGAETWVTWKVEHGFGLEDEAPEQPRFSADTDTASIALQKKRALMSELEEA